jgi:sugar phosphate isomerase/epimerase
MHPRVSLNLLCYDDLRLADAIDACVSAGFHQMSIPYGKLEAEGLDTAVDIVRASGLEIGTIGCGPMFTLADRERWGSESAALNTILDVAASVGAKTVYGAAGSAGGLDWDDAVAAMAEAASDVAEHARQVGVPLIFESTNPLYADIDFVHSFRNQVEVAERTGLGMCLDLFPVWEEPRLVQTARDALSSLHMVQLGDYCYGTRQIPNRAVPGDGVIPLHRIIGGLLEAGYRGFIDLELLGPRIDQEGAQSAAVRSGRYMSDLLDAVAG